jgi:hypothetical protein
MVKTCKDAIKKEIDGKIETVRAEELRENDKPNEEEKKTFEYRDSAFDLLGKAVDALSKQVEEVRKDLGLIRGLTIPDSWNSPFA